MRELQHRLKAVLDEVAGGETIEICRRRKAIARLVPIAESKRPEPWPNLRQRLKRIYGDRKVEPATSERIYADR